MANAKRKKAMATSDLEKKNYERLQKVPEENKVTQNISKFSPNVILYPY